MRWMTQADIIMSMYTHNMYCMMLTCVVLSRAFAAEVQTPFVRTQNRQAMWESLIHIKHMIQCLVKLISWVNVQVATPLKRAHAHCIYLRWISSSFWLFLCFSVWRPPWLEIRFFVELKRTTDRRRNTRVSLWAWLCALVVNGSIGGFGRGCSAGSAFSRLQTNRKSYTEADYVQRQLEVITWRHDAHSKLLAKSALFRN